MQALAWGASTVMGTTSSATGEHGQDCHSHSKAKLLGAIFEGRSSAGKDQSMMLSQMVICAIKLYVHAPGDFIYQFPITGQSSFRQGWSINWVELLQEPDCDIGNLSKGELLSDTYSRASVEWEVVESKFAPLPSFWIEAVSIRAPKFWVWVHCPKLHGRDVSTEEKPEAK